MRLYRTTPGAGGVPIPITNVVTNGGLALSPKAGRLIYTSRELLQNLFQLQITATGKTSQTLERLTSTTGELAVNGETVWRGLLVP